MSPQFIFDKSSSVLYFDWDGTGTDLDPLPVATLSGFTGDLTHGGPLLSVDEFQIV